MKLSLITKFCPPLSAAPAPAAEGSPSTGQAPEPAHAEPRSPATSEPRRPVAKLGIAGLASLLMSSGFSVACGGAPDASKGTPQVQQQATSEDTGSDSAPSDATEPATGEVPPPSASSNPPASPPDNNPADLPRDSNPADPAPGSDPSDPPPTGDPTEDDANLKWFKYNGFAAWIFAGTCVSKKDGEPTIEVAPLPVGGGRRLECTTAISPTRVTKDILTVNTRDRWCGVGNMTSYKPWGDSALKVSVTSSPDSGPWTLVATHDGEPIMIDMVEAAGLGFAWPVGVHVTYTTTDLKPNPNTAPCDQLFGL